MYGKPRIFNNLLSSQPLCFNLFGELSLDLELATAALSRVSGGRISRVCGIDFEHSPGRGDPRYLGDKSAFDVFVRFETPGGGRGFAGIEVKYHEALTQSPSKHRERYDELSRSEGCFELSSLPSLRRKPLQQIWRDHLLVCSMRQAGGYDDGFFVFLHPVGNLRCSDAVAGYRKTLLSEESFLCWTLEDVFSAVREQSSADWLSAFHRRYLDFGRIDRLLSEG